MNLFKKTRLHTAVCAVLLPLSSFAQSGSLDTTFGVSGKVITPIGSFGDWGNAMAVQSDEKIVVGGYTQNSFTTADFSVTRYDTEGNLDHAFGIDGKATTYIENRSIANAIAIQSDGKIILGGASNWHINLARYTTDGSLDTTFGSGGIVVTDVEGYYRERCESLVILNDGKVLVAGYAQHNSNDWSYFLTARYNSDGSIDSTFATNGISIGSKGQAYSAQVQSDGKIVLGGQIDGSFALERYASDGTLDTLFGTDGTVVTPIANHSEGHSLIIRNDDKLLLAGTASIDFDDYRFALAQYNNDGTPDTNFGQAGIVTASIGSYAHGHSAQLQNDGKILLAGYAKDSVDRYHFAMARYNVNGSLDGSFGTNGKTITSFGTSNSVSSSIAIQNNNKIVLAGYVYDTNNVDIALARYLNDELLEIGQQDNYSSGHVVYPNPSTGSFCIQLEKELENGVLNIYHSSGQLAAYVKDLSGLEIHVSENKLPPGSYYFQLLENELIIATEKLWIEK